MSFETLLIKAKIEQFTIDFITKLISDDNIVLEVQSKSVKNRVYDKKLGKIKRGQQKTRKYINKSNIINIERIW